jgi:hypothetical protein
MITSYEEFKQKAQEARKKKITPEQLSSWGKKGVQSRIGHMTPEEKSEYFKKIRKGIKVNSN